MGVFKTICSSKAFLNLSSVLRSACYPQGKYTAGLMAYSSSGSGGYVPRPQSSSLPGLKHVYEPDYLDKLKPEIPCHDLINLKMVGYDFVVLENYQKLVHLYLKGLDVEVETGYALRADSWRVQRFAPKSSKAEAEFHLKEYQRILQLSNIPSTKLSLLFEILQAVTPPGVTCSLAYHTEEDEKLRFIPDLGVKALQEQLVELGGPSKLALQKEREAQRFRR